MKIVIYILLTMICVVNVIRFVKGIFVGIPYTADDENNENNCEETEDNTKDDVVENNFENDIESDLGISEDDSDSEIQQLINEIVDSRSLSDMYTNCFIQYVLDAFMYIVMGITIGIPFFTIYSSGLTIVVLIALTKRYIDYKHNKFSIYINAWAHIYTIARILFFVIGGIILISQLFHY